MIKTQRDQRWLYTLTNLILFLAGLVNIIVGTYAAVQEETPAAIASLAAGLVFLFAATIDRFESIKGLGVEAKTRQLDQKIEEADLVLAKLKTLAEITGASLIDLASRSGRLSAPTIRESYALAQRIRSNLIALDTDELILEKTLRPWIKTSCFDMTRAIVSPLTTAINSRRHELQKARPRKRSDEDPNDPEISRIHSELTALHEFEQSLSGWWRTADVEDYPEKLLKVLAEAPFLDGDVLPHARDLAEAFAPDMIFLRRHLYLENPLPWFKKMEEYRKSGEA